MPKLGKNSIVDECGKTHQPNKLEYVVMPDRMWSAVDWVRDSGAKWTIHRRVR
jgi:hypothetical protein